MNITWYYNILIFSGTLVIALMAFAEQISKKTKIDALNHLWFKSIIVVFASLVIYWASENKEEDQNQIALDDKIKLKNHLDQIDSSSRLEKRRNDSILNLKIDSAKNVTIEALAKYNLILIDSLKQVTSTINEKAIPAGEFTLAGFENGTPPIFIDKENGQMRLCFRFESKQSTSYNINLSCFIVQNIRNQATLVAKNIMFTNESLVTDRTTTSKFNIPSSILNTDTTFLVLKGYFYNDYRLVNKRYFRKYYVFSTFHNSYFCTNPYPSWDVVEKLINQ